jgi:Uma2 family endonuclease
LFIENQAFVVLVFLIKLLLIWTGKPFAKKFGHLSRSSPPAYMKPIVHLSEPEYLAQESQAEYKSEYHAGQIVAMAGASYEHNVILNNLIYLVNACLWNGKCQVLPSDMLIRLTACDKYVYADLVVVCEPVQLASERRQGVDVLLNPTIVVEVLSASTELYDRAEKFACYLSLPSLRQYVLVDSQKVGVETYTRTPEGDWLLRRASGPAPEVRIGDCQIALADIYNKVTFPVKVG